VLERLRKKWRSMPAYIRKGLLRLYIAVAVLWIVWFGSQIVAVVNSHPYGPIWRYISQLFWTLLFVPVGGPIFLFIAIWVLEGFAKPQIDFGNLRDRVATDILFRPDVAAYEFLATGSLFGKKYPKVRLDANNLSAEQKAVLPNEFYGYGADCVDPAELAKIFAYHSGDAMIDCLAELFTKWGYVDRNQMLNKIVDEEVDRRKRKTAAHIQRA